MIAIARRTLDVEGQHVIVGPWSWREFEEFTRLGDIEEQLTTFAGHIEAPADPLALEMLTLVAIMQAWSAEVAAATAKLRLIVGGGRRLH